MPRVPLVIGELNYSVFPCRQEVDLAGGLLNAETMAQFLCEGGDAAYYYGYEPNKLDGSSGSWGNQLMLLTRKEGMVPVATFQTLRMLSQEWIDPRGGTHGVLPIRIAGGSGSLHAYGLRRPDGSTALLLINMGEHPLEIAIRGIAPKSIIAYSREQYRWLKKGAEGHPIRNESPSWARIPHDKPISLPPRSVAVVRSEEPGTMGSRPR
jgi:hypothetical protein